MRKCSQPTGPFGREEGGQREPPFDLNKAIFRDALCIPGGFFVDERMTLALAWNLQQYALVAADCRVTMFDEAAGHTRIVDDVKKVFEVQAGITTGSGMIHMMDALFAVINITDKAGVPTLPERLRAAEAETRGGTPKDKWWSEHAERTGVFLATARKGTVSINLYHTDENYDAFPVPVGIAGTLLPEAKDEFEPYEKRIALDSRALKRFKSIDASIEYHLTLLASFMKRACLISSQLSPTMTVGLLMGDGSTELMNIMPLDTFDVEPLELKGDEHE